MTTNQLKIAPLNREHKVYFTFNNETNALDQSRYSLTGHGDDPETDESIYFDWQYIPSNEAAGLYLTGCIDGADYTEGLGDFLWAIEDDADIANAIAGVIKTFEDAVGEFQVKNTLYLGRNPQDILALLVLDTFKVCWAEANLAPVAGLNHTPPETTDLPY